MHHQLGQHHVCIYPLGDESEDGMRKLTTIKRSESVDLLHPNKTDVLPYLADTKPAPARYARAMLMFRSAMEPYMQEWMVGPLPISNQTKAQPLTFLSTRKSDNKLRVYNPDFGAAAKFDENITSLAANAIKTLWNVVRRALHENHNNCTHKTC